jgi:DNA-binding protein HU-beta
MNKTEFITALAEKTGMKKTEAEKAVKGFTELVAETLRDGEKVSLVGFGTFEVLEREAREGRNPRTGKTMTIPASKAPKFKAGRGLKEAVNEK